MTENEAKEKLTLSEDMKKKLPNLSEVYEVVLKVFEEVEQYRAIGTVEEFKALKEKAEPKKPIIIDKEFKDGEEIEVEWKCPVCGLNVIEEPPCQEYCQKCGNKLDWE